jgi:hypothetical protein
MLTEQRCVVCSEVKEMAAFALCQSGLRHYRRCLSCMETEAYGIDSRKRTWWRNGKRVRRCSICKKPKPLNRRRFPIAKVAPNGRVTGYSYACRPCTVARKAVWTKRALAAEDAHAEKLRVQQRATQKAWREANPEKKAAARRRWLEATKADPVRHAALLEARRIEHRLRAERAGRVLGEQRSVAKLPPSRCRVPSLPIVELMERIMDARRVVAEAINEPAPTIEDLCDELGVTSRNFRRWRDGEQPLMEIGTAERVLLRADVDWSEVYSYDDFAGHFLAEVDTPV